MLGKIIFVLFPQFSNLDFPNEMRQNYLVLKGMISVEDKGQKHYFPIKIVIPQGFPFHPPRVYLDMPLKKHILEQKSYLGQMNSVKIPYITNWTQNQTQVSKPKLDEMIGYLQAVLSSDPPIDTGLSGAMYGGQPLVQSPVQQPL